VLTALDTLTLAPERFTPEAGIYLGLRSIYFDLRNAKSDDQLRDVVARLWQMALQLEDGNVSQAEQALRQAQDALRQALERGASDEELKKLMDPGEVGAAPLLGIDGLVFVGHGRSDARSIINAVLVAQHAVDNQLLDTIRERLRAKVETLGQTSK
jgi:hypothetical protein